MKKLYNFEYIAAFLGFIIIILIPLQKLMIYILNYLNITHEIYNIHIAKILWFTAPIFLLNYIIGFIFKKIKIDITDYLFFILSLITIISTIFTVHYHKSLYGEINRYEGVLTLLSYYIIFLNIKNIRKEEIKKLLINTFLIMGVAQVLYGILQVFTTFDFIRHFKYPYMAFGLSGNPNFFGALCVMLILISSTFYLLSNKIKYLILSIIYMIGLTLANSTGPMIGFIIALIYFIIIKRKNIKVKNTGFLITIFILTFFGTNFLNDKYQGKSEVYIDPNFSIQKEVKSIVKREKTIESFGNGRITLWLDTLPVLKKYWLFGSGPDTFARVYPQSGRFVFDKAHNIYLQMAVTTGMFSLIIYLVICFFTSLYGIGLKNHLAIALNLAFIGYSIQGFANISVIEVAPFFFIIWALNYSYYENVKQTK